MREQPSLPGIEAPPTTLGFAPYEINRVRLDAWSELDQIALHGPGERRGKIFACWLDDLTPAQVEAVEAWARRYAVRLMRLEAA